MTENAYVVLTGAKNNAGDFLIKRRAIEALERTRPDRNLVLYDAWKPFEEKDLDVVNSARALILAGGPSLQKDMYPRIYPLVRDLDRIKVPVVTMGVGWKSETGTWEHSRSYEFSPSTLSLIRKLSDSGYTSSVRDYHSENALRHHGMSNVMTTGCPALFAGDTAQTGDRDEIRTIGFSLGVSFLKSARMQAQMREVITKLRDEIRNAELVVAFHHSLDDSFLKTHGASEQHLRGHRVFAEWLSEQGISYTDISGSAERMIDFYSGMDFHIGYRVHAHILMTSLGKKSVLLAEDGRGIALKEVIGNSVIDAIEDVRVSKASRVLSRFAGYDRYRPSPLLPREILAMVREEISTGFIRSRSSSKTAELLWSKMDHFTRQLP